MACLQSEFRTKYFFELRIFIRKTLRNFPRICCAFILWVRKNPTKFPPNFPPNFPAKNQKNITDELLQERRENHYTQKLDDRQITHLISVHLKHLLYDFWGVFWASFLLFSYHKRSKAPPKKSYSECLRGHGLDEYSGGCLNSFLDPCWFGNSSTDTTEDSSQRIW